jgi:hypothetical protein
VVSIDEALEGLARAGANLQFRALVALCPHFFGEPRIRGSHHRDSFKGAACFSWQRNGRLAKGQFPVRLKAA